MNYIASCLNAAELQEHYINTVQKQLMCPVALLALKLCCSLCCHSECWLVVAANGSRRMFKDPRHCTGGWLQQCIQESRLFLRCRRAFQDFCPHSNAEE